MIGHGSGRRGRYRSGGGRYSRPSEPDTPEEAVQSYVDAVQNKDWSATWDLMCESEQRSDGPRADFLAERAERPPLGDDRRIAGEALRIQPFPIEAWRVSALVEGHAGIHTQHLVIRENGRLRVCGDPLYLYEARSGIA